MSSMDVSLGEAKTRLHAILNGCKLKHYWPDELKDFARECDAIRTKAIKLFPGVLKAVEDAVTVETYTAGALPTQGEAG